MVNIQANFQQVKYNGDRIKVRQCKTSLEFRSGNNTSHHHNLDFIKSVTNFNTYFNTVIHM